jgi:hypothetical protein
MTRILLIFCVLCAFLLIGCGKTETNDNNTANTNKAKSAGTAATTAPAASSSDDKVGVPECDEYIAKYESCTSKVPEAARAQYKSALEQMRASWKKLAANPATKASLASACKQAAAAQAAAWKTYGCAN